MEGGSTKPMGGLKASKGVGISQTCRQNLQPIKNIPLSGRCLINAVLFYSYMIVCFNTLYPSAFAR